MNRTPWQLWDLEAGEPADGADTLEAAAVLERAMAAARPAMPPSRRCCTSTCTRWRCRRIPERALRRRRPAARPRPRRRPPASHAHPHRRAAAATTAMWSRATSARSPPTASTSSARAPLNFYTLYRCHDYHFKIYGAMFLGQPEPALEAADELAATLPEDAAAHRVAADGRLAGGLRADAPARPGPLRHVAGDHRRAAARRPGALLRHHRHAALRQGRRATPRTGDLAAAEREREPVPRGAARACPDTRYLFNNTCRRHPRRRRARCWTARSTTAAATSTRPSRHLRRSVELDDNAALRRAVGLDAADPPRAGRAAARAGPRRARPRRSTGPTWGSTTRSAGPASTPTTSGACTATTSACAVSASQPRPTLVRPAAAARAWPRRRCRSQPRASAAARRCPPRPDGPALSAWPAASVPGGLAAVDVQDLAGDERRPLEVEDRLRDVADLAQPAERLQAARPS